MHKAAGNPVDLTGGLESLKSHINSPSMRSRDSYSSTFHTSANSRTLPINQEINQQEYNIQKVNPGRHVSVRSNVKSKGDEIAGMYQHQHSNGIQAWDSSIKGIDRGLNESRNHNQDFSLPKEAPKEGCFPSRSNSGQFPECRNPVFTENGLHHSVSSNQNSSGFHAQQTMGPHKFQYHPMGNLGMNMESADISNPTSYPQGVGQFQGLKNQDQGHLVKSQFSSHVIANNATIVDKTTDFQRKSKDPEEAPSRSSIPYQDPTKSNPLDGRTTHWAQNKQMGQASQNMLELLQKVDQSRDNITSQFNYNHQRTQSEVPKAVASERYNSFPRYNQSSPLQGFGLQLAPPSQRQSSANQVLPPKPFSHDLSAVQLDQEVVNNENKWSEAAVSARSLPPAVVGIQSYGLHKRQMIEALKEEVLQQGLLHVLVILKEVLHGDPVTAACSPQIPSGKADGPSEVSNVQYEQDLAARHLSDGNPALPISSLVHPHQREISRGKQTQNTAYDSQAHVSFQKVASSRTGTGAYHGYSKPSDVRQQNFYAIATDASHEESAVLIWIEGLRGLMELMELSWVRHR
ncbi:hypothetical protein J5N97_015932 [Dioscorea zingiberensis]|uniref:Uncharacterized protein n=1 Tax=Dioscorea zingiberensis TaxID=325984 RepID=A0A9D5HF65_9LILI|nr:hypothetical protein J5N97_015932 [Dioscorea zingiberensis]